MTRDFVVIASGPSLTDEDVDHVRGKAEVITVNTAYQCAPWADHVYAYDLPWWNYHMPIVRKHCTGKLWTGGITAKQCFQELNLIETLRGGAALSWKYLINGQNSGMQALTLACVLGAKRIYMLGFDAQHTDGERHFHGLHPDGWANSDQVLQWHKHFDRIAPQMKEAGIQVVNCSRVTALRCFDRATIQDVLP